MTRKYLVLVATLGCFMAPKAALADSVLFTLLDPVQTGAVGSTLSYQATVSAPVTNAGVEYLNGDDFTTSGSFTVDDSGFGSFPLSLNPGDSFTGALFTVAGGAGSTGTTTGTFSLLGGSAAGSGDVLGSANFSAQLTSGVAATPEPSSFLLLGSGLLGAFGVARRRFAGQAAR